MCVGNPACGCQSGINPYGLSQLAIAQQHQRLVTSQMSNRLNESLLGRHSVLSTVKRFDDSDFDFIRDYFVLPLFNEKNPFQPISKMKITGKEYLVISGTTIAEVTTDLDIAKSRARELAHSTQGSVYIFQPVLEVAPKRDVVETTISLAK